MDIYESLINGNKRYGSNKDHICESNFKCKSFEINEKVITDFRITGIGVSL